MNNISINSIMRAITTTLDIPVKIILVGMLIVTIIMVSELIAEYIQRRKINVKASNIIDAIKNGKDDVIAIIKNSSLALYQKRLLLEVILHNKLSNEMRENLAVSLLDNYSQDLDFRIKRTDLIVKLGPTFGLLGTLIPLGPGIIALSQGDTETLSRSLLAAFDTTVIGLVCGAIATVISLIRKKWYNKDKIVLSLIMEAIVENENSDTSKSYGKNIEERIKEFNQNSVNINTQSEVILPKEKFTNFFKSLLKKNK